MADANITNKPQPMQGVASLLSKAIGEEAFDALNKFRETVAVGRGLILKI